MLFTKGYIPAEMVWGHVMESIHTTQVKAKNKIERNTMAASIHLRLKVHLILSSLNERNTKTKHKLLTNITQSFVVGIGSLKLGLRQD